MAKLINETIITKTTAKLVETSDSLIINGQVYDKSTLEPKKFQTLCFETDYSRPNMYMNTHAKVNSLNTSGFYNDNNVIIDQNNPEYSYVLFVEDNGHIRYSKLHTKEDGTIEKIWDKVYGASGGTVTTFYGQDVNYLYGAISTSTSTGYIYRINKKDGAFVLCNISGSYSQISLIKETPLYFYLAVSFYNDRFSIVKYNKSSNSMTTIYADDGTNTAGYHSWSTPMVISENEVLAIRCNYTFDKDGIDCLILKKYLIDYTFDVVYDKNISLDCSSLPKGVLMRINNSSHWYYTNAFISNDELYFTLYHRSEKYMYLIKKISDANYSVLQKYDFHIQYNGAVPYDNGKTLMFYSENFIDFMSFRLLEERFELASTLQGEFNSIGVDKNKIIWVQHKDTSVDMVGLNVPTIAETLFVDTDLCYMNQDIESFVEVYCKNFDGKLLEADLEINLNGEVVFTDTGSRKRKVRTSAKQVIRIPITIKNSGFIEANTIIL